MYRVCILMVFICNLPFVCILIHEHIIHIYISNLYLGIAFTNQYDMIQSYKYKIYDINIYGIYVYRADSYWFSSILTPVPLVVCTLSVSLHLFLKK